MAPKRKKNKLENYPQHRTERNQIKWPVDRICRLADGQYILGGFLFICLLVFIRKLVSILMRVLLCDHITN